jgi:DNA-binding NtrC family response regulator
MVYGVIRRHEGTLEIESEPGRGATLRIRLPLHTPAMKAVPKTAPALERLLHILVVEDNPRTCEILTEFLTLDGHTFETAIDGREGWEKFDPNRFDLVITDRAMPQMSGDLLTAAIKQVAPNKPVIMLTGFGNLMKASNEQPAGVDVLVSKPVTLGALRQALAQALGFSPG